MATVYGRINGMQIEKLMALQEDVQTALDREVFKAFDRAEMHLNSLPHRTGHAQLGVEEGDVDRYLFLEDPPGDNSPGAAMSIELGHKQKGRGRKVPGHFIISKATGLKK